ncbi:hypothetical protein C8R47DRAFT_1171295 [Mycena vitilis]|nr:hypothetical protein C8R47DRAFT_1171295 [Mycena vitilis]
MSDPSERYFWALISPSPRRSLAYFESPLADAAARKLICGRYLALVLEPSTVQNPRWGAQPSLAVAHLVQRVKDPLPDVYLPIAPCQVQSVHPPLTPSFAWPFGDCVIYTGKSFMVDPRRVLPHDAALSFTAICDDDDYAQRRINAARTKAEKAEVGVLDDEDGDWSAFSGDSAEAEIVPGPGQFFPPSEISADVFFDIESLSQVLPANRCFEDVRNVERLRARFSRSSTERTIIWTLNQPPFELGEAPPNVDAPELENDHLLRLSSTLQRPPSPDISSTEQDDEEEEEEQDPEAGWGGGDWLDGISVFRFPPRPKIEPCALVVMYFDLYGTLIVRPIHNFATSFNHLQSLVRITNRASSTPLVPSWPARRLVSVDTRRFHSTSRVRAK